MLVGGILVLKKQERYEVVDYTKTLTLDEARSSPRFCLPNANANSSNNLSHNLSRTVDPIYMIG
jgi:hypothetical protein